MYYTYIGHGILQVVVFMIEVFDYICSNFEPEVAELIDCGLVNIFPIQFSFFVLFVRFDAFRDGLGFRFALA